MALTRQTIGQRPVKARRTAVRDRYFHFLIFQDRGHTWLEQRTEKDIWQNLYQFPLIESESPEAKAPLLKKAARVSEDIVHLLSHQRIHARFYHFKQAPEESGPDWRKIPNSTLQDYPIPRLIDRYIEKYHLD
jgi:A/G-specific adenine glycosylase